MPGYYIPNPNASEELMTSEDAQAAVINAALGAAEAARELTPNQQDAYLIVAGGYEEVDEVATSGLVNNSSIWHIIEFGSRNNPPYRPMTAAIERVGMEFHPEDT